jgi:hypothetical protein
VRSNLRASRVVPNPGEKLVRSTSEGRMPSMLRKFAAAVACSVKSLF